MLGLDGRTKEQKIEEAKNLLLTEGYLVTGPCEVISSVSTLKGLVKFFYESMLRYNRNMKAHYSSSSSRDLSIAKAFVEGRASTGISQRRAITECCIIIDSLFKYEDELGLDFKITQMSILTQEKFSWLVEKALDIYNGYNKKIEDFNYRIWEENMYSEQENNIDQDLIDRANKRLGIKD